MFLIISNDVYVLCVCVCFLRLQLFRRNHAINVSRLKLIILSSLTTWGGKVYSTPMSSVDVEFNSRIPLACAFDKYSLENALAMITLQCKVNMCIIGCGLFYGAKGYDLAGVFR